MFTLTGYSGSLVTTVVTLTGAAILHGGAAAADPNQDDQFLALLNQEDIPALTNVPSLIATAHKDCRQLDGGMPVADLVDEMKNDAYGVDPIERSYPNDRLTRTMARFITAAVEAYCPYDQRKIASIMANPALGSNESTHRAAAYAHNAVNSGIDLWKPAPALDMINAPDYDAQGAMLASLIGAVPPEGITPPSPQIPAPPPTAQTLTPRKPIAAPRPPKQSPPPPKQPPPPPKQPPPPIQAETPAVAPQPGGAAGSGGSGGTGGTGGGGTGSTGGGSTGGTGGDGPAKPPPTPPMPPGFVRLAP